MTSAASFATEPGSAPHPQIAPDSPGTENVSQDTVQEDSLRDAKESVANSAENQISQQNAVLLLQRVLTQLVAGPAFDAKVRETVWTTGREVVGVGTYEQAGGSTGRYNLQLTMHDGDGKHRLQQISDGRLAWTRTDISGRVALRRVDVGRLDEWVRGTTGNMSIAPRLKVGAWAEMLSTIERDYVLAVVGASLKGDPVWVITGELRQSRRKEIMADSGRKEWPMLFPTRIRVAIRSKPEAKTNFGELLPVRIEYWSDPVTGGSESEEPRGNGNGRLITLIELYSIRPISPPPAERFRFENQDAEVNFTNETDRYIEMYGVHLTERERRQLRR
ncbi:MAG: hypothetical protein ACR2NZ_15940 [Rubripirellula sp.]